MWRRRRGGLYPKARTRRAGQPSSKAVHLETPSQQSWGLSGCVRTPAPAPSLTGSRPGMGTAPPIGLSLSPEVPGHFCQPRNTSHNCFASSKYIQYFWFQLAVSLNHNWVHFSFVEQSVTINMKPPLNLLIKLQCTFFQARLDVI